MFRRKTEILAVMLQNRAGCLTVCLYSACISVTGWFILWSYSRGTSGVVVTRLRAGQTGHCCTIRASSFRRWALKPHIWGLPWALLPAVKRLWREGYPSSTFKVGVKKEWSCTATYTSLQGNV